MKGKRYIGCFCFLILSFALYSCSGSKEQSEVKTEKIAEEENNLNDYEKSFDPSKYDLPYEETALSVKKYVTRNKKKEGVKRNASGFRVQTTLSGEFEDCQRNRNELQKKFPDIKTYIVHEFPFYKLRIGDFQSRKEAEKFIKVLIDKDIKNGLIVPDKISIE